MMATPTQGLGKLRGRKLREALMMQPSEYIVTAFPERCSGPGWSNRPLWVIVGGPAGLRRACLQPEQWYAIDDAGVLAEVAEVAHNALTGALVRALGKNAARPQEGKGHG